MRWQVGSLPMRAREQRPQRRGPLRARSRRWGGRWPGPPPARWPAGPSPLPWCAAAMRWLWLPGLGSRSSESPASRRQPGQPGWGRPSLRAHATPLSSPRSSRQMQAGCLQRDDRWRGGCRGCAAVQDAARPAAGRRRRHSAGGGGRAWCRGGHLVGALHQIRLCAQFSLERTQAPTKTQKRSISCMPCTLFCACFQ